MRTYDFVAIGLGPFNLGLACLSAPIADLDGIFLEQRTAFDWHPGLMIDGATIQVPFLADLVTMADPTSPYSFLNFLKQTGRLYPFYIRENFYPLRAEYNAYCQWASSQLANIAFGRHVQRVEYDGSAYVAYTSSGEVYRGRYLILGVGTRPHRPDVAHNLDGPVIHSAEYLSGKAQLQSLNSITVIGSGQSAAEIYLDLLNDIDIYGYRLTWATRSPRFFPMEYTKLTLELTSPEYIAHFHSLPEARRDELIREQRTLYKGISGDLVNAIYDTLYEKSFHGKANTSLWTDVELACARWDESSSEYRLGLRHREHAQTFEHVTHGLVLATGYRYDTPTFLDPIRNRINWDSRGRYAVNAQYAIDVAGGEIFVQNAEEHTHGFTAPDLGMGAYRNSVIIAKMLGREVYPIEQRIAFQQFGLPEGAITRPGNRVPAGLARCAETPAMAIT